MANTLNIKIITPLGIVFEKEILSANVPTVSGVITILARHIPLISKIHVGECVIENIDNTKESFAVYDGILEVRDSEGKTELSLLIDRSEKATDIDLEKAESALRRAQDIKQQTHIEDSDFARFESMIDKELNRIKISKKYR